MRRYGVTLALVALLAGCSGNEHAGSLPSLSPAPTTSSPPASPTDEVAAAARAYYAALEKAGQTGDVAPLRAMIADGCECKDQVDYIDGEHRAGHHFTTRYTVESVSTHDVSASSGYATVTITYAASSVVDAKGQVVRTLPGKSKAGRDLLFRKEGATWRLARLVLIG